MSLTAATSVQSPFYSVQFVLVLLCRFLLCRKEGCSRSTIQSFGASQTHHNVSDAGARLRPIVLFASIASLLLNVISTQPCRISRPSRCIPTAAQRNQQVSLKPQQGSTAKRSGQVEIDEVPFFDRFHNSITGFPFPLGPFLQRRTIRKEVGPRHLREWEASLASTVAASVACLLIQA